MSWVGFELGWARRSSAVLLELPFYRTAVLVLCRSSSLPFYRTAVLKAAVLWNCRSGSPVSSVQLRRRTGQLRLVLRLSWVGVELGWG